MLKTRFFQLTAMTALTLTSHLAMAHLNIAVEDGIAIGDGSREYKEGSSAFLDVNISHDCSNEAGMHFPTTGVAVLLPNAQYAPDTFTADANGNYYGANAVMGVKQRINSTFEKNIVMKGPVEPFYNHGIKSEDARALKWFKGKVDNDHYENLEFKANFPKIDPSSCVAKIKMYFPSMQYCTKGYKMAWVNTPNSKYGLGDAKTRVYDTYSAYATVVRTSELAPACGAGETVEIMPSVDEINMYLDKPRGHKHHHKSRRDDD